MKYYLVIQQTLIPKATYVDDTDMSLNSCYRLRELLPTSEAVDIGDRTQYLLAGR